MSLVTAHPLDLRKWCWTKERKNPHLLVIRRLYGVFTNKLVKKQSIRGRTPVEPHLFLFFQRHCSLLITQCPCVSTSKKKQHVPAIFVPSGLASQGHSHRMWFPGHSGCCTAPRWTYFLSGSIILWENLLLRLLRACCNALQARATWWTMIKFDNTCFFFLKHINVITTYDTYWIQPTSKKRPGSPMFQTHFTANYREFSIFRAKSRYQLSIIFVADSTQGYGVGHGTGSGAQGDASGGTCVQSQGYAWMIPY